MKHTKQQETKKDKEWISAYLLLFGLAIMVAGFSVITLYFNLALGIYNEIVVSTFWIFAVIPLIAYFFYLKSKGLMSFSEIGLRFEGTLKSILLGSVAGAALGLIGWFFLNLTGSPVEKLPDVYVHWFILSSVFSAPIREEILVRGLLWSAVERTISHVIEVKKWKIGESKKGIMVVTIISVSFMLMHWGRPLEIMFTTLLIDSFAYSLLYYKTKNLVAPITAHAISNLFVVVRPLIFL